MKKLFFITLFFSFFYSCDTNEVDNSMIQAFGATSIDKIQISGNEVKVTTTYGTPTPCWYYYKTENQNFRNTFISKVFGKYDGQPCIEVTGSFRHEETILFSGSGNKTLRFWQNDSTYLDTVIVIQ
ncbi:MAG: hypothetical protein IT276_11750 [Ignavibacteriaceae bacterium]|nr:hypothetical protein [Ignavibacteriaceae bacterium]